VLVVLHREGVPVDLCTVQVPQSSVTVRVFTITPSCSAQASVASKSCNVKT
jgi:hypothetical protein